MKKFQGRLDSEMESLRIPSPPFTPHTQCSECASGKKEMLKWTCCDIEESSQNLSLEEREANARCFMETPEWKKSASREDILPEHDTSLVPGYGSDSWKINRVYQSEDGAEIRGFDCAVDYFISKQENAVPGGVLRERKAFIVIGFPGAGKTTIATVIRNLYHAMHIVGDDIKPLLPEYDHGRNNGGIMVEKDELTAYAQEQAVKYGTNIVFEAVGRDARERKKIALAKSHGYSVALIYMNVPKAIAMERAVNRFRMNGRPVSLKLFDNLHAEEVYTGLKAEEGLLDDTARIVLTNNECGFVVAECTSGLDALQSHFSEKYGQ